MRKLYMATGLLCLFLIPRVSYGCSCGYQGPPVAFNGAKAVFVGRMLGGTENVSVEDGKGKYHPMEAGEVRFAVEQAFKGSLGTEITVRIASHKGTSCGPYGLRRGERYVVYGYSGRDDAETLYSGVCTRTAPVDSDDAKEDLDFLRNLPPAGSGGSLTGSLWADLRAGGATPLPNVKVNIRGDGQIVKVNTDQEGRFEVKNLKPGKYRVEPEFPANYVGSREFQEVTVEDLGTASVGFEAYINGRVRGRVVDRTGRGFNSIFLHLVEPDKSNFVHSTGEGGAFQARGVPPGEYVLYLEMQAIDYKKRRNYYYPGTFERDDATIIKVGLAEQVEGLVFKLPEGFNVHTIRGQVTWEDGKTASGVEVLLLCPGSAKQDGFAVEFAPTTTVTNELGQFQLEGFSGEVYWIEARARQSGKKDEMVELHSRSRKIVFGEDIEGATLVLSEKGSSGDCGK